MISIVIATYNRAEYLEECLESALNQTIPCEIVVINDGGKVPKLPKEVRFFDRPHKGAIHALNYGINQARGDYIFNLDDDDLLAENAMERFLEEIGDYDVIFCDQMLLFPDRVIPFPQKFEGYEALIENDTMPGQTFTTKEAAQKVPFPDLKTGFDYERYLLMCEAGLRIKHLPEYLYYYRQHEGQIQKVLADEQTANNNRTKEKRRK